MQKGRGGHLLSKSEWLQHHLHVISHSQTTAELCQPSALSVCVWWRERESLYSITENVIDHIYRKWDCKMRKDWQRDLGRHIQMNLMNRSLKSDLNLNTMMKAMWQNILSIYLSIVLSFWLFFCLILSIHLCLSVILSVCCSAHFIYPSVFLSVCLSISDVGVLFLFSVFLLMRIYWFHS